MVGAVVVGLIATGIFFFMRKEPQAVSPPTKPITTPVVTAAAATVMVETQGQISGPNGQVGGAAAGGQGATAGGGGPSVAGGGDSGRIERPRPSIGGG
ncbi:MAG: hypothetical protein DYH07_09805 [Armatimonadetes bacterium ATM1]|nr:hypothetical protein [Armatimonadetes bacterium ATM1]